MSDMEYEKVDKIWVDLYEAAELTGYNLESMRKLAYRIGQQDEAERPIKIRKSSSRWQMWLPDLVAYTQRPLHGPRALRTEKETS